MIKVKEFWSDANITNCGAEYEISIADAINNFLEENPSIEIVDIKYNRFVTIINNTEYYDPDEKELCPYKECYTSATALIIYKEI